MKSIIVVKREGKIIGDKAMFLDIKDINYLQNERIKNENKTVIYTDHGEYIYCTTNDLILELLSHEPEFFITDRGRLANLDKLDKIDYDNRKILYNNSGFVTIAASRLKSLKEYILKAVRK